MSKIIQGSIILYSTLNFANFMVGSLNAIEFQIANIIMYNYKLYFLNLL